MIYSNLWPNGDWARRHLNWALILYSWLALIPGYSVLFAGALSDAPALTDISLILFVPTILWAWYLSVWNLKHKGRSMWNLLYLLIPWIGGIVFLCVSNRDDLAKEKAEREEREKYREEYWKRTETEKPQERGY